MLKKMLTAEGIAGRLPYAILTKMVKLVGWKRIELNKLFTFDQIDDTNFESIVRRCAVIRILAKFFDPMYLKLNFKGHDHEQYGIFAREADAGAFLTSEPGVLAGLLIQHAFAEGHSEQDCRKVMEGYTRCGDDNGATVRYIRLACGLSVAAGQSPTSPYGSDAGLRTEERRSLPVQADVVGNSSVLCAEASRAEARLPDTDPLQGNPHAQAAGEQDKSKAVGGDAATN
jgi:hypothetical protein